MAARRPARAETVGSLLRPLAVSPQCGFASVADGNDLDEDAQWRELEVVALAAERVWD